MNQAYLMFDIELFDIESPSWSGINRNAGSTQEIVFWLDFDELFEDVFRVIGDWGLTQSWIINQ